MQINFFFFLDIFKISMKNNRLTYITMKVKGNVIEAEVAHQLPTSRCLFEPYEIHNGTVVLNHFLINNYQFQIIIKETCL